MAILIVEHRNSCL